MAARRKKPSSREAMEERARIKLLEEALGLVMSQEEAKKAVESLQGAMGNFVNMSTAPEDQLAKLPGMSAKAARFLHLTVELAKACMEGEAGRMKRIMDSNSSLDVLRPKFLGLKTEAVGVLLMDGNRRLLYSGILSTGSVSAVPLYIRQLIKMCIDFNAQEAVLAHNHPSGSVMPSREDIIVTEQIEMALMDIDASLDDHIIIAGDDEFSFLKSGIMERMTTEILDKRRQHLDHVRWVAGEYEGKLPQ